MRKGNKMTARSAGSLPQRPHFFKLLFPGLSAALRIPRKFQRHLPSELPKLASLLCPHDKVWNVEVSQSGPDILFQRGWPEFMKAHDMHTGYFLLFQYNGNMNFEVKVFDTTCCLKDYSLKHCTREVPPYIEIEDSSTSKDPALNDTSDGETLFFTRLGGEKKSTIDKVQTKANELSNVQREPVVGTNCKKPAYIEIDESEDQTINKISQVSSYSERWNSSNSTDKETEVLEKDERVVSMDVESKKPLKIALNAASFAQFEKILTPAMVQMDSIHIPRKFCVNNDLITNHTIFLKRKLEGAGKADPREWQVGFFFGPSESRIRTGWRTFSKENGLKIGDRCIFRLVSKDTLLVETHCLANSLGGKTKYFNSKGQGVANEEKRPGPQQNNVSREIIVRRRCKRPALIDTQELLESNSQKISKISDELLGNYLSERRKVSNTNGKEEGDGEKILKTNPSFICYDQFEKILTCSMVESHLICLPRAFCVKNDLVTNRTIILQRKLEEEGKTAPAKWSVGLNCSPSYYRFRKGWKKFSMENNLKIGDRCTFQLVSKDTFIVQTMPFESLSIETEDKFRLAIALTKKQIARERKDSKNNLQCERIMKGYNFDKLVSLPNSFCKANGLTSKQTIFLKRSIDGKAWSIGFRPYIKEGRFSAGWKDFARRQMHLSIHVRKYFSCENSTKTPRKR